MYVCGCVCVCVCMCKDAINEKKRPAAITIDYSPYSAEFPPWGGGGLSPLPLFPPSPLHPFPPFPFPPLPRMISGRGSWCICTVYTVL